VFSNPTKKACKVSGYKLTWAANKKAVTTQEFPLPPGETRDRWIKLDRDDGDLATLTAESGKVELVIACGP
jgi:hypothetical protein